MITVILFLVVLGVLVFVHELGHFLTAKAFGMRVLEFGLGFPPRAWSYIRKGTRYSLNWIPIGGFVRIWGENGTKDIDEEEAKMTSGKAFTETNRGAQAIVLVAGVTFNVIFAWLILTVGYLVGVPQSASNSAYPIEDERVMIVSVMPKSPADKAGLKTGDEILSLQVLLNRVEKPKPNDIVTFVRSSEGKEITVETKRGNDIASIKVVPEKIGEDGAYAMGIMPDNIGVLRLPIHLALVESAKATWQMIVGVVLGFVHLIGQIIDGNNVLNQVAGPVGIAGMVKDASTLGFGYLISFAAFISINLAVLNILPIPALDGGRLLFVAIESIVRRPIPVKWQSYLNLAGFGALILLLIVATIQDIIRLS